jgi:hypothetical protein
MAMLQSEYLRRTIAEHQVVISRNKVRDSSEQTFIRQAQASKVMPSVVQNGDGVTGTTYGSSRLNGTGGDYTANLQIQIGNAVCCAPTPTTNSFIIISSIQENHTIQPWSQETAAVNYKWMGKQDFFPPKLSATCSTNQIQYPFSSG